MSWQYVADLQQIPERTLWPTVIQQQDILVLRAGEQVFAYLDRCSHQDVKLSEFGEILPNGQLICYAHGACFDLPSGAPLCFPASTGLQTFPTRLDQGKVYIDM